MSPSQGPNNMKALYLIFFLSLSASADVSYLDCSADALTFASHTHPVAPLPECAVIVDAEADKIQATSGLYRAYGKEHMIYLDLKDAGGNVVSRELLAGDQTELVEIKKIFIDVAARRLYVIQLNNSQSELLVYKLDFIGNVTPLNVMRSSTVFGTAASVKAEGTDKIEVINASGTFLVNADAETRSTRSVQKALVVTPK